jgi:hypothetical protein
MSNEQLAHELLLKPTFQLTEATAGGCEVINEERIRASFQEAFWKSLADDLWLSPPCYVRVLRVLADVRDGIAELAGEREASQMREVVDLDLIRQQTNAGVLDWTGCIGLVA